MYAILLKTTNLIIRLTIRRAVLIAAMMGLTATVRTLLDAGANLDEKSNGSTPLEFIVGIVATAGADIISRTQTSNRVMCSHCVNYAEGIQ